MGIIFAVLALLSWGIGDFLIQKSTRKFGDWISLFYIEAFSTAVLFPFVYKDLAGILSSKSDLIFLILTSALLLFVAIFDFEALKRGKISVVEPIFALEVLITASLSIFVLKEALTSAQMFFIAILIIGIILVSIKSFHHFKHISLEKGVTFAFLATAGMGVINFLFGVGSRLTSPLLINWFTGAILMIATFLYLVIKSRVPLMVEDFKKNKKLVLGVSFVDNFAWVAYSFSTLYIPIAIATGISESYIALAAVLGIAFNKEKLNKHQIFGLPLAIIAAVILAVITL